MAQYVWGDTGQPLAMLEYVCRDNSWLKLLPAGSRVISTAGHGSSYWSQAGKITVALENGKIKDYFIKLCETHVGKIMCQGEYESSVALHAISPDLVAEPIGWGTYETSQDLHWYLCSFEELHDERYPEKVDFCRRIADMHTRSQASGNGKFGFKVPTCNGTLQTWNAWTSSWEKFFVDMLDYLFRVEAVKMGPSAELGALKAPLLEKVCPRLLRPLETGGNILRPSLVHADLWHGNTARRKRDDSPCIFDCSAIWGHNEYDMHGWRDGRFVFTQDWVAEYFRHCPPSEPKEDCYDRNLLYSLVSDLNDSVLFHPADTFRNAAIKKIRGLVERFPEGYTGPHERKPEPDDVPDSVSPSEDDMQT